MRIILAIMVLCCCAVNALADGPQLFKEFSYGQPRAEIAQIKGVIPCNDLEKGALCRDKQTFAGNDKWGQGFVFSDGRLSTVVLKTRFDEKRFAQTMGVVANNGYSIVALRSGTDKCDVLNVIHTKGKDSVNSAVSEFEAAAINGRDNLIYTFVANDTVKQCGKISTNYPDLVRCAPENMRAVEMELSANTLYVRFVAPKAVQSTMQKLASEQTESF